MLATTELTDAQGRALSAHRNMPMTAIPSGPRNARSTRRGNGMRTRLRCWQKRQLTILKLKIQKRNERLFRRQDTGLFRTVRRDVHARYLILGEIALLDPPLADGFLLTASPPRPGFETGHSRLPPGAGRNSAAGAASLSSNSVEMRCLRCQALPAGQDLERIIDAYYRRAPMG
jgi:hypothetical protein